MRNGETTQINHWNNHKIHFALFFSFELAKEMQCILQQDNKQYKWKKNHFHNENVIIIYGVSIVTKGGRLEPFFYEIFYENRFLFFGCHVKPTELMDKTFISMKWWTLSTNFVHSDHVVKQKRQENEIYEYQITSSLLFVQIDSFEA